MVWWLVTAAAATAIPGEYQEEEGLMGYKFLFIHSLHPLPTFSHIFLETYNLSLKLEDEIMLITLVFTFFLVGS